MPDAFADFPEPAFARLALTDEEFRRIRDLVYARFGIHLSEQKRSLVVGRLQKTLRKLGYGSFGPYLAYLEADESGQALSELIDRISTNHTFFFREKDHFDFFRTAALPEIVAGLEAARTKDLRIWCAGCATGEEAYTLVMTMMDALGPAYAGWDAGLLATDISENALATAREGVYGEDRVAQVPPRWKGRYLRKAGPETWRVDETVRAEVTFRRFNLINPAFPFGKPFHAIFCRNVMIYFDRASRERLVNNLYRFTAPGGYLFIGHSESLGRETCPYRYLRPAVYRREA